MRMLGLSSLLLLGVQVHAHSMYQSAVLLDFVGHTVSAELQLPLDRLSISFRQTVDNAHLTLERTALLAYVQAHVHPVSEDNRPFGVTVESMDVRTVENAPYLVVHLLFRPPAS